MGGEGGDGEQEERVRNDLWRERRRRMCEEKVGKREKEKMLECRMEMVVQEIGEMNVGGISVR